jgi:hypothetical protein
MFHRVLRAGDGVPTPWLETAPIAARRWSHAAWFPRRRQDKAMFEISNELCALVNLPIGDPTRPRPSGCRAGSPNGRYEPSTPVWHAVSSS